VWVILVISGVLSGARLHPRSKELEAFGAVAGPALGSLILLPMTSRVVCRFVTVRPLIVHFLR
jgi:hypothetical protein